MSFYSYKNANAEASPGSVGGNVLTGLNKRVCIQVKNVYDSCLCQEQLDDKKIVISNIVPVLPGDCHGTCAANCPAEAISEGNGKYVINADSCMECGTCAANCPVGAISVD